MRERMLQLYSEDDDEPYEFRLPPEVRPVHYDLEIDFDFQQIKFNGILILHFKVLAPVSFVALHCKGLSISTDAVQRVDHRLNRHSIDDFHSFPFKQFDYWITWFQNKLKEGEYQIRLRFAGRLHHHQIGIFYLKYSNNETNEDDQRIIATRFVPNFARLAFPCMDEPEMKATFSICLIHPDEPGITAISNMNIETKSVEGNKIEVHFHKTPPMSTHMLGFIIGNLKFKTEWLSGDVMLHVSAVENKVDMTEFAARLGETFVDYFTDYFDIPYPLPKLDLVAIPGAAIGMAEQWGLVFFEDTLLLFDPQLNTSANTQHIAMLVAHAIFRMWMGCLVSSSWWDEIWLAKGLASYMEYKCVQQLRPDWGIMDQFLILEMFPIMAIDSKQSHPLASPIETPRQIPAAFDKISFMKSAALMRMIENFVGEETLRAEASKYLTKFAYANGKAEDFISVLQTDVPDKPIEKIFKSFTEKNGFPFITVTRLDQINSFRLSQQIFLSDRESVGLNYRGSKEFLTWTIPITYVTNTEPRVRHRIFHQRDWHLVLTLEEKEPIRWIKLNKDAIGYYRVNYSLELWQQLINALSLEHRQFSISDRAQLLSDCFAFANAGILPYSVPLEMIAYVWRETDFVPWYVVIQELKEVVKLLRGTDIEKEIVDFVQNILNVIYRNTSWTASLSHLQNLLRVTVLDAACTFGLAAALKEAADLFSAWLNDPDYNIQPDLKGLVLLYGMDRIGTALNWELVWDRFHLEQHSTERRRLLHSLSAIKNPSILKDLLDSIFKSPDVTDEEVFKCFWYVSGNARGQELVWNYVRKSWTNLLERFGNTNNGLSQLIPQITAEFKTPTRLEELNTFIDETLGKGISISARNEAVRTIEYNINWLSQHESTIQKWLSSSLPEDSFHSAEDFFDYSDENQTADV